MPPSDNGHVDSLPSHEVLNQPSRFDFSGFLELLLCMVFVLLSLIFNFSGLKVNERTIPYQSTENGDILLDFSLMHSVSDMTVSDVQAYLIAACPLLIVIGICHIFPISANADTARSGMCAFMVGVGTTSVITHALKLYVGRLRPNFYALCNFDTAMLECTASASEQTRSRLSFPSGHASGSFYSMTFLTLFFLGRLGLGSNPHQNKVKILLSLLPLLLATWVSTSRIVDNWHHPSDVIAGISLGAVCAIISYHLWHPTLFSEYPGISLRKAGMKAAEETQI